MLTNGMRRAIDRAPNFLPALAGGLMGAGMIAEGIGSAVGGGGETEQGFTLPPELEMAFLDTSQQNLTQLNEQYQQISQLVSSFNQRLESYDSFIAGQMPSEQFQQQLADTGAQIAQSFGGSAMEAIQQGFLDEDSARLSGLVEEREGALQDRLTGLEAADLTDPRLENELQKQRADLEQRLRRSNVSPAQRAAALQQFEQSATEQRFSRAEQMRTSGTQRAIAGYQAGLGGLGQAFQQQLAGRQFGLTQAQTGFGALQGYQQGLASLQQSGLQAGALGAQIGFQGQQQQADIGQQQQDLFRNLGQFSFSKYAQQALHSGLTGPGSVSQQLGVGKGQLGIVADMQTEADKLQAKRLGLPKFPRNTIMGASDQNIQELKDYNIEELRRRAGNTTDQKYGVSARPLAPHRTMGTLSDQERLRRMAELNRRSGS